MREHRQGARGCKPLSGDAAYDDLCRRCFVGAGPLDRNTVTACTGVIDAKRAAKHVEEAHFMRGLAWGEIGDYEQARTDMDRAIEANPDVPLYYLRRARFHVGADRHARQLSDYERAAELDSRDTVALTNAASVWFLRNIWTRAIQCLDRVIEIDPSNAQAYYSRYLAYSRQGNEQRALRDLDRALELAPGNRQFLVSRSLAHFRAKRFELSIPDFTRLMELEPGEACWPYARGVARLRRADVAGGQDDIANAKAIDPKIAGSAAKEGIVP